MSWAIEPVLSRCRSCSFWSEPSSSGKNNLCLRSRDAPAGLALRARTTVNFFEGFPMVAAQKNGQLDIEAAGLPEAPTAPESLREAGLSLSFLNDLVLRTLYVHGSMLGLDLARFLCLPFKVLEESLKFLKIGRAHV